MNVEKKVVHTPDFGLSGVGVASSVSATRSLGGISG